jgi:hypothetical protein
MQIDLKELGLTDEKLIDRIVDQLVNGMDADDEDRIYGRFERILSARIEKAVVEMVEKVAVGKIETAVGEVIDKPWRQTNRWGEDKKEPMTFKEMVADRVGIYLDHEVRKRDGSPKPGYSDGKMKRVDWLIKDAVKTAVGDTVVKATKEAADKARDEVLGKMNDAVVTAVKNILDIKP